MKNNWIKATLILSSTLLWTLFVSLTFAASIFANEPASGQSMDDVIISVNYHNAVLSEVFNDIESKTDFTFLYHSQAVRSKSKKVHINIKPERASVADILKTVSAEAGLKFWQVNNTIAVKALDNFLVEKKTAQMGIITGTVTNAKTGKPMIGVSVYLKRTTNGDVTNKKGIYKIADIVPGKYTLIASFIGFKKGKKKIKVEANDTTVVNFQLVRKENKLNKMVVTGIVKRKRETFTGATSTYSGEELRAVGTKNIIQSLKALDPSFAVIANNKYGSDPNRSPKIEVRGKSSISQKKLRGRFAKNPNQPLFILNGFETNLQTILNLDMNRIKSITLLKDAASTSMYGARAANGVVVVETVKPTPGNMRVSYSFNLRINRPILSVYNLMNAKEKLRFEKLSGLYDIPDNLFKPRDQLKLDSVYNFRLKRVRKGVNTYWLGIPVHTGISRDHSLNLNGGNNVMRYGIGVNYQNTKGVMKGSGRKKWGVRLNFDYRKGSLNISNNAYVRGFNAFDSPYGSFANFARVSPYYRKKTKDGSIKKYFSWDPDIPNSLLAQNLNNSVLSVIANPLYNAQLGSRDNTDNLVIQDNIHAILDITDALRLKGGFSVKKGRRKLVTFIPPGNTRFDQSSFLNKGRYRQARRDNFSYQADIMLTYARVFGKKNSFTGNLRASIQQNKNGYVSMTAVGFPEGANGNPGSSFSYLKHAKPLSSYRIFRRSGFLATINYSYDQRYLLDATYRLDGSTAFGSEKPYSTFWSIGVGWNLQNEAFFNNSSINTLRLRANIGTTGNQNFGSVVSTSVYRYDKKFNLFGEGLLLGSLGNPGLNWQNTTMISTGLDLVVFNNRLSVTLNAYRKYTKPLVVILDLAASTGLQNYHINVGDLNTRGLEANFQIKPISSKYIIWNIGVTGRMIRSEYGGFGNRLKSLNRQQLKDKSLIRYSDGHSPTDIWAVRSMGIDPVTGGEVFLKRNGKYTYQYDTEDITAVGNTRPDIIGTIRNNLTFRVQHFGTLHLGFALRYSYGSDILNYALYNKVENITKSELNYNHDIRALYDRWKNRGDLTRFKNIASQEYTPISSRFVQENNYIMGESLRLGYRVDSGNWMRALGLKSFRINLYLNNFFRLSTVKRERGIYYPFARSISSNIRISF